MDKTGGFSFVPCQLTLLLSGTPVAAFILLDPGDQFKAIEGNALGADRDSVSCGRTFTLNRLRSMPR